MKSSIILTMLLALLISLFAMISKIISVKVINKYQYAAYIATNAIFCIVIYLITVFFND